MKEETGVATGSVAISVMPDDEVNLGPVEETLSFPAQPGDEAFARRWFPRELRVRIDVTATAPDDRWLSRKWAKDPIEFMQERGFLL